MIKDKAKTMIKMMLFMENMIQMISILNVV